MDFIKRISMLVVGFTFVLFAGCGEETVDKEEVVALVNEEEISREDFESTMDHIKERYQMQGIDLEENEDMLQETREGVLDQMISETLLLQKAEEYGIEADEEEVEEEAELIRDEFETEEELQEVLAMYNIDVEELEEEIRKSMVIEELLSELVNDAKLEFTEAELKERYEQELPALEQQAAMEGENGEVPEFEELEEQLERQMTQEKMGEMTDEVLEELREESEIEIFLDWEE